MNSKQQKILIASIIGVLLLLQFGIRPLVRRRDAKKVITKVLTLWMNNDIAKSYDYWKDVKKSPPFYDVESFKIIDKKYFKQDGTRYAQFIVTLNFSENNVIPSGQNWVFILEDDAVSWQIIEFYLLKETEEDEDFL